MDSVKVRLNKDFTKSKVFNYVVHPITSTDRITLGGSLTSDDAGLHVWDKTTNGAFYWTGTVWTPAGYTSFLQLTDTPDSYVGSAIQVVRVNAGETALEFHVLVKGDVGLSLVDNTPDTAKPISTATQTALDLKADKAITITATGNGITGGGSIAANRTIALDFTYLDARFAASGSGVLSFNARTGVVTPQTGDYTTAMIPEVTNLYYTLARFNTAFAGKSTSDLGEGSNLYYTDVRADARIATASGVSIAPLVSGLIPGSYLPSYVDDVLEFANLASFPITGETGKIYVALDTNKTYRWGGSSYMYITSGAVDSVNGGTGIVTINVTGTSNRISVTGSTGLVPTIDISSSYVGQTSISTLGTITAGTWNATPINISTYASGTLQAAQFPALTGEATTTSGSLAVTLTNSAVIGKVLTGYISGVGTVSASDSILQAIQKLNGNIGAISGTYIQNQTSLQSSSNFNISGIGNASTSFTSPLINANGATINIGGTNTGGALGVNGHIIMASGGKGMLWYNASATNTITAKMVSNDTQGTAGTYENSIEFWTNAGAADPALVKRMVVRGGVFSSSPVDAYHYDGVWFDKAEVSTSLLVGTTLTVNTIAPLGTTATIFLTHTGGLIQSRTAAQVLSDIGAAPATGGGYVPYTGATSNLDLGVHSGTFNFLAVNTFVNISGTGGGAFLLADGAAGSYSIMEVKNTSGRMFVGIEGSTGATVMLGSSAYDSVITSQSIKNLHLGTNQTKALTIVGSNQNIIIANTLTVSGLTSGSAGNFVVNGGSGLLVTRTAVQVLADIGGAAAFTPSALTKTDDTNITLTLGGSPSTALVNATSITVGWSGTLAVSRGGTGVGSVTTSPTASSFVGWDANKNLSANSLIEGYTTTVTAAGTTTLVVGSTYQQYFTGSTTQTVLLPVVSTLVLGQQFKISNSSTGVVTVQSSGGNIIQALAAGSSGVFTCILTTGTTAASWSSSYIPIANGYILNQSSLQSSSTFNISGAGVSATSFNAPIINANSSPVNAGNLNTGVVLGVEGNILLTPSAKLLWYTSGASNTITAKINAVVGAGWRQDLEFWTNTAQGDPTLVRRMYIPGGGPIPSGNYAGIVIDMLNVSSTLIVSGTVTASISDKGSTATTFLTHTSGLIQSRTNSEVLSDLGISTSYVPYTGATTDVDFNNKNLGNINNLTIGGKTFQGPSASTIASGQQGEIATYHWNTTANRSVVYSTSNSGATGPVVLYYKGRGTIASATPVQSGDSLGQFIFGGQSVSSIWDFSSGASCQALADATWSSGSTPTRYEWSTTPSGSNILNVRMTIKNSGRVLIGTTTDNGVDLLQVNGSLTASSIAKSGGTSSQFLKADGSIDSSTYVTTASNYWSRASTTVSLANSGDSVTLQGGGTFSVSGIASITGTLRTESVGATPAIGQTVTAGTSGRFLYWFGTGGALYFGMNNSTGTLAGVIGASAYSTFFGGDSAFPLHLVTNNTVRVTIDSAGATTFLNTIQLKNYTVATLPVAGTTGRIAYVTDALTPSYNVIIVGGGSIVTPVFDNGTNWVAI